MNTPASNSARRLNGGHALAEMLRIAEVGPMFGMGGFQLLPFYDALGQLGMRHFLINDERCGAFAADAYARVTNRPGICDGTLGPGATNLVTGLVESLNGGIPVVAIAGDTNRAHSWKNMTQECRQVEILKPAVKELIRVEMTSRIPELVRRAFAVATSGRPGPVLLDIPEDVAHGTHDFAPEDFVVDEATLKAPARQSVEAMAVMSLPLPPAQLQPPPSQPWLKLPDAFRRSEFHDLAPVDRAAADPPRGARKRIPPCRR